jgi:hypothetical protein
VESCVHPRADISQSWLCSCRSSSLYSFPLLICNLVVHLHLFIRIIKFHCKITTTAKSAYEAPGTRSNNDAVLGTPSALGVEAEGVELDLEVRIENGGCFPNPDNNLKGVGSYKID